MQINTTWMYYIYKNGNLLKEQSERKNLSQVQQPGIQPIHLSAVLAFYYHTEQSKAALLYI